MTNRISLAFKTLKPLPLNNMYSQTKTGRRFKSKKAVEFENRMTCELIRKKHEMFKFEIDTSVFEHFLTCKIVCELPRSKLITKKGTVNTKSGDVDNFCKPIIDNIFKFMDKLDDSIILQVDVCKRFSQDNNYNIYVEFTRREIIELDDL